MNVAALVRVTALTTILAVGASAIAKAQTAAAPMGMPGQSTRPSQPGMTGQSMMGGMGQGGMGSMAQGGMCGMMGRMGGMSQTGGLSGGMMGGGHMTKVMFAIADTNGDGRSRSTS